MVKRIYISGPITNAPNFKEAFQKAEDALNAQGYEVVNPCKLPHDHGKSWAAYISEDLKALLKCPAIYMMQGWWGSLGACVELRAAKKIGLRIIYEK